MRILDKNNISISNPDMNKGYLLDESIIVKEHPQIEYQAGTGHYEKIGYETYKWVQDTLPVAHKDAWTETEEIKRYIEYTPEELRTKEEELTAENAKRIESENLLKKIEELELLVKELTGNLNLTENRIIEMNNTQEQYVMELAGEVYK